MRIYEFGKENPECILLIHPSLVTWDYFEYAVPLLEEHYHLLIPALPGYDLNDDSEFSSVETIALQLAGQLADKGIRKVNTVYGCSMGGSIALRMAIDEKLHADNIVMDGGITPYQLPWILTRFIALRDFGLMALGKIGGEELIVKAFSSAEFSEEDMRYAAKIFHHCTYKTLWNTFDSCNNYRMPKKVMHLPYRICYWYAEKERKARDWDIRYMKKYLPDTVFKCFEGMDHGDMALFYPQRMAAELRKMSGKQEDRDLYCNGSVSV
ncbi:MAG: alpha/beta hydrolase [Erysipelotrichaceae bacterium]|nr:alpha/beta hydrolase [Erysipelotrichaceae bacterium]